MKTYKISYTALTTNYPMKVVRSIIVEAEDKSTATTKAQRIGGFHWSQIIETKQLSQ